MGTYARGEGVLESVQVSTGRRGGGILILFITAFIAYVLYGWSFFNAHILFSPVIFD